MRSALAQPSGLLAPAWDRLRIQELTFLDLELLPRVLGSGD